MYVIFVKNQNGSWHVNLSGPFETKSLAVMAARGLHQKLNVKLKGSYKFAVQYVDKATLNEDILSF